VLWWLPQRLFAFGRRRAARYPVTAAILEAAYRVHSPLTFPLAIPRERRSSSAGSATASCRRHR
jgi:hypothetical protein